MELYQNLPNFFKMIQQRAQNGQILGYLIAHNMQIGGNYKNFHRVLVALWGNYKVSGQNIHPCFIVPLVKVLSHT